MVGFLQQQIDKHRGGGHQTGSDVDAARAVAEICVTATKLNIDAYVFVKLRETSV